MGPPSKGTILCCFFKLQGNTTEAFQIFRYLMKRAREIRQGQTPDNLNEMSHYFFEELPKKCLIDQAYAPNFNHALQAFEHLSKKLTLQAYDKLEQLKQKGRSSEVAWNECSVELCKVKERSL